MNTRASAAVEAICAGVKLASHRSGSAERMDAILL